MRRLFIRGGRILDIERGLAERAELVVAKGAIEGVLPADAAPPADAESVDAEDRLLVPGLVNAHTHAHGALGKGLVGDRVPLEVFLSAGGAINGSRTAEDKYLSAALSAVEMVRRGCTAAYDLFIEYPVPSAEGVDAVAEAYRDVGMRAVIAPTMADRSLFEALPGLIEALPEERRNAVRRLAAAPYAASLAACRAILQGWRHDSALIHPAIAPTIPLHCSDAFLVACRDLAREFDLRMQTHLAETRTQAVLGRRKYGKSLTAHLGDLGLLDERLSAAHAVWLEDDDMRRLADAGCAVVHNPMSNLRIGSGIAPVRAMLEAGLRVGIGTDASNTSDGQNMFEAARLAAYLSRAETPETARWLSVEETLRLATTASAEILGFEKVGRLAAGWKADIVFLDLGHITYVPLRHPARQLLFAESGAAVASVMIDGRFVLRDGRFLTIDEAALKRRAEAAAARLDAANAGAAKLADAIAEAVGLFCIGQSAPG
jgi:guanine deaminase